MSISRLFTILGVAGIVLSVSACGPGQLLGPTLTPTATNTPIPTNTPTPTLTPTPIPPVTVKDASKGLSIDGYSAKEAGFIVVKVVYSISGPMSGGLVLTDSQGNQYKPSYASITFTTSGEDKDSQTFYYSVPANVTNLQVIVTGQPPIDLSPWLGN